MKRLVLPLFGVLAVALCCVTGVPDKAAGQSGRLRSEGVSIWDTESSNMSDEWLAYSCRPELTMSCFQQGTAAAKIALPSNRAVYFRVGLARSLNELFLKTLENFKIKEVFVGCTVSEFEFYQGYNAKVEKLCDDVITKNLDTPLTIFELYCQVLYLCAFFEVRNKLITPGLSYTIFGNLLPMALGEGNPIIEPMKEYVDLGATRFGEKIKILTEQGVSIDAFQKRESAKRF